MSASMIAEMAREYARRELAPRAGEVDRAGAFGENLFSGMGELGLLGLLVPEAYGGAAQNLAAVAAAIEALAGACGSTAWAYLAHNCASAAVAANGNEALKSRLLPQLAAGTAIGAVAGTEDTGGSTPMGIQTTAKAEGDGYVLNGTKIFISNAGFADVYVILARTGDQPGPNAFSLFVVEKGTPGFGFGRREETLGVRGVNVGELRLENCWVPKDNLLGAEGGGLMAMAPIGGCGVVGAAAAAVGLAQAAVDLTRVHVKERLILGKPLATLPGVQQTWVGILTDLEAARALTERAVSRAMAGGPPLVPWLAKAHVTETAQRIVDRCLQLHGANGYSTEFPLERMYRDARALSIHWGNNDVLRANAGPLALG